MKVECFSGKGELVGVIPAAGRAERIQPVPCSKELIPIGMIPADGNGRPRVRVAMSHLLESFHGVGVQKAFVVLRKGKWDIPNYFGAGMTNGIRLAYLVTEILDGVPFSVDQAYPYVQKGDLVLFGFPDIVYQPINAFDALIKRHRSSDSDITLGLFPSSNSSTMDMVKPTPNGGVVEIQIKPSQTALEYTWIIAVWGKRFFDFMHTYLQDRRSLDCGGEGLRELQMGDVINQGLSMGQKVSSVTFPKGRCQDIGTPEGLQAALGKCVKSCDWF
jgi:glucose-1-phosphate thymidylyltransferase